MFSLLPKRKRRVVTFTLKDNLGENLLDSDDEEMQSFNIRLWWHWLWFWIKQV